MIDHVKRRAGEGRPRNRGRGVVALTLALLAHAGALWVLFVVVGHAEPLAPPPRDPSVEITLLEPPPAPPPTPVVKARPSRPPPRKARAKPPPPAAPADDEAPFPRHAYGDPPPPPPPPPSSPPAPAAAPPSPPAAPAVPVGPRTTKKRSLLDRVTQGFGPGAPGALPGGDVVERWVREAPPAATDADRAKVSIQRWAAVKSDPNAGLRSERLRYDEKLVAVPEGGYEYKTEAWQARIFPDGTVVFDGDIASYEPGAGHAFWDRLGIPNADLTSGTFDATDALMRIAKLDPYAAAKQCFLDDTEPVRDELRQAWKQKHLQAAIARLGDRLDELWAEARPAGERRAAIFELYDSCSNEEAGRLARRAILSWVRRRLPAGSEGAYSREELVGLNDRRTQDIAFDPYGDLVVDGG